MKTWIQEYGAGFSLSHNWLTGHWSFTFPLSDGAHYITRNYPEGLKPPKQFAAQFSLAQNVLTTRFVSVQQPASVPCRLRLYFQTVDDATGASFSEDGRWWSNPQCLTLKDIGATSTFLGVTFDPVNWSNVNGHTGNSRVTQFLQAASSIMRVGFTLGADFFGHGVYAQGAPATLTILKFKIT